MLKRISTPAGFLPDTTMTVLDPSGNQGAEMGAPTNSNIQPRPDFHYSQRLFHGPNGNVFSVLSPAHGRSNSMKPTFLCRQPRGSSSAREPRSRSGRRGGGNRCLKFHNFIPSESITSEKDDGSHDDVWKVHAECKLQEEHGTKQIMVSQWSVSSDVPSNPTVQPEPKVLNHPTPPVSLCFQDEEDKGDKLNRPSPDRSYCPPGFSSPVSSSDETAKTPSGFVPAKDELFTELSSCDCDVVQVDPGRISPVPATSSPDSPPKGKSEILYGFLAKKHRRKPTQTRRVVPYKKYLSLLEDDASSAHPLDLSLKTRSRAEDENSVGCMSAASSLPFMPCCSSSYTHPYPLPPQHYMPYQDIRSARSFEKSPLQVALEAPLSNPPDRRLFNTLPHSNPAVTVGQQGNHMGTQVPFGYALYSTPCSAVDTRLPTTSQPVYSEASSSRSALMAVLQNCRDDRNGQAGPSSISAPELHRNMRKPSQRSLIKQKLEDTFKQNGFLVKTKQVSDGDATFCKFRQLRKYTRYYLKSWHHHLPAEVHKLWKGFLPPKTHPGGSVGAGDEPTRDNPGSLP
ncbi:unnamed protein product [Ixodes hexagonus]